MSLFGSQGSGGSSLFGSNTTKPTNPFAAFGSSQPAQQSGLFTSSPSSTSQPQQSGNLFGSLNTTQQQQPQQTSAGGLFGSTSSQPQQSGGLFGSIGSSQPQQQTGGLFGSTNSQPQQQQTGGLFGSTTSQPQQQTGGLFGSTTAQPQQQSGGLFGSTAAQPQQQQTGGLFGSTNSQPQQQTGVFGSTVAQQPQQTGGLFGGQPTQNKPTLSLFGNNNSTMAQSAQLQQQPQQQPSLFGAPAPNTQQKPLFGSTNIQQTPQAQPSLFGSTANKMPGTLTMGQANNQAQQQQTVPGVRIDVSNLRGTTRFNDLHDELQKQIEQIDAFIQQQITYKEQCDALMPAHEQSLSTIPNDVSYINSSVEAAESALEADSSAISTVKAIIQQDVENARIGFRAVENLKLPQQFHYSGIWNPSTSTMPPPRGNTADRSSNSASAGESTDLVAYFNAQVAELSKTLETYKRNISEIETHLGTVEASSVVQSQQLMFRKGRDGGARSKEEQIRELAAVLREFEGGILGVASKLGQVRENVVDVVERSQGGILAGRR